MPQLVHNDDPLNAVGQITVDYNQFAPRRNQEKALAGLGACAHRPLYYLDVHARANIIRVGSLVFHFQTICFLFNRHRQQSTHLTSEVE